MCLSVSLASCLQLRAPQPAAGSTALNPLTLHPGNTVMLCCFIPAMSTSFSRGNFLFLFFRALTQDDQDDIHLKLEDIIQLVSSPRVLRRPPLKGQQCAWTECWPHVPSVRLWEVNQMCVGFSNWSMMRMVFIARVFDGLCTSAAALSTLEPHWGVSHAPLPPYLADGLSEGRVL